MERFLGHLPVRRTFEPREYGGRALKVAAHLDASCPGFLLSTIYASCLKRQALFAAFAAIDLNAIEIFASRLAETAPDVLAGLDRLDSFARTARALTSLKAKRIIEATFGGCPAGLLGAFARLGPEPLDPHIYTAIFDLFSDPRHGHRAGVLGQLQGLIRPDHVVVVSSLHDVLVHRAVLERAKPAEIPSLNTFVGMIMSLCAATPQAIKESLDSLPTGTKGVKIGEWAQSWMGRQVRLPVPLPIPDGDPDLRVCLGAEQASLGRRFRNCAESRMSYAFLGERVLVEWIRPGEQAVIELAAVQSGSEQRWEVTQLLGPRNRRAKAAVVAAIRERLDGLGILYQSSPFSSAEQDGLHSLLEHYPHAPFPDYLAQRADDAEDEDADIDRMLDELEQEIDGREAA